MQFNIQIVVEADGVPGAITPEAIAKGTIVAVTPKQQAAPQAAGGIVRSGGQFQNTTTQKTP